MEGDRSMREKLDIKILILFILRRLPGAVDGETLSRLAMSDVELGYFEWQMPYFLFRLFHLLQLLLLLYL